MIDIRIERGDNCEHVTSVWIICKYTEYCICICVKLNTHIDWKRRQDQNNPIFCQAGLAKIHCSTFTVSHILGGRRVGWIMTFVISAILDVRVACLSILLLSLSFSLSLSLSFSLFPVSLLIESNVGPCWTRSRVRVLFLYLFLPRSLCPLFIRIIRNFRYSLTLMYKYFSISRLLSHIRAYLSAFTLAKDLPKVSCTKGWGGEKIP